MQAISSASVGGGFSQPSWALNIGVDKDYDRIDLAAHAAETAAELGLHEDGSERLALFTAADVSRVQRAELDDLTVDATVGITLPTWAAGPASGDHRWRPGTINMVIELPVALDPGAAVNAVMTATEAKSQALFEGGVPGTGTASDAVLIVWPDKSMPEPFAGPRSFWGSRLAQATFAAVSAGIDAAR